MNSCLIKHLFQRPTIIDISAVICTVQYEVIGERYNTQFIFSRREISRNRIKTLNDLSTHRIYRDFKAKPEAPV